MFSFRANDDTRRASLFGSSTAEARDGRSAEKDLANLGKPRIKRTIKQTTFDVRSNIEEVQYQMSMVVPSKVFNNKKDR